MKEYTVKVDDNGTKSWHLDGKLHREDGPAIEWADGNKSWYLDGRLHREDGPAVEQEDGTKYWYLKGKRHREDGPAVERSNGDKEWWLYDERLTEEEHKRRTSVATMDDDLIAAAPELLEALMDFIEMFNADDDPKLIDLLNKGRAAITKAKGMTVRVSGVPQERHHCELRSQSGGHGEAVDVCFEDEDGKLWVENGEYASVVFYCPVCGYASRAKANGE